MAAHVIMPHPHLPHLPVFHHHLRLPKVAGEWWASVRQARVWTALRNVAAHLDDPGAAEAPHTVRGSSPLDELRFLR